VNLVSALDIVAHVRSLPTADTMTPKKRPFQPGGVILSSDQEFGQRLFGSDQWPASITRAQVLAQDPRIIPIALQLPVWGDEASDYDWLPGNITGRGELPPGVQKSAQSTLDAYYAQPSIATAVKAAQRIRIAAHDVKIPDAPCTYATDLTRYDPLKCAEAAKWGASLIYVEGIRAGDVAGAGVAGTKEWWETGHLFHKAQQFHRALPQRDQQIAGWIYLGWMWDRALNKNSLYGGGPLDALGMNRHSTWVTLRTMVERPSGSVPLCADVENLGHYGAAAWMQNAMTFAYKELQYRSLNKQLPADHQFCAEMIRQAQVWVSKRAGASVAAALQPLADATKVIVLN
jgi:hypothetical protein